MANQQSISDPKYAGTRVSRKDLDHLDEDEEIESDEADEDEEEEEEEIDEEAESDEEEEHDASEHEDADGDLPQAEPPQSKPTPSKTRDEPAQQEQSSDLASTLRATREQDRKKGKAVARQIVRGTFPASCQGLNSRFDCSPSGIPFSMHAFVYRKLQQQ